MIYVALCGCYLFINKIIDSLIIFKTNRYFGLCVKLWHPNQVLRTGFDAHLSVAWKNVFYFDWQVHRMSIFNGFTWPRLKQIYGIVFCVVKNEMRVTSAQHRKLFRCTKAKLSANIGQIAIDFCQFQKGYDLIGQLVHFLGHEWY